ncbi:hypothetical protein MMC13_001800 [Lambiella insularis]|nr:hypothetical protein [Lambiella insularis]
MDAVQFYQPMEVAGRRKVGRQAVSSSDVSMARGKGNILSALGPHEEWSGILLDDDPIEVVNLTGLLPEKSFNLFQGQARDLDNTEKDVGETANGLKIRRIYGRSGVEKDDNLPNIENLLFGARNTQEWWQPTGSSDTQATGGSEGNLEDAAKNDHNTVASPGSTEGENEKESVPIIDNGLKDRNNQEAQREADGSINVQTCNLIPDREDKEREAVCPDKPIGTHDQDTRTNEFIVLRKQKLPFKTPPTLESYDWDNRAPSSRKEPGSPDDPIVVHDR